MYQLNTLLQSQNREHVYQSLFQDIFQKKYQKKSKKLIDEIKPYYRTEAISKFAKELDKKNFKVVVTEKDRALKNYAKSFEVSIISIKDAAQQLYNTRSDVARVLEGELSIDRGIKVEVTLKVLMKKKKIDEVGEVSFIFKEPYFNCKIFTINNKYEIIKALDKADEEINK